MTMTLDSAQQQRFGGPHMNFDYPPQNHPPAFSNPWPSSSSSNQFQHQPPQPLNPTIIPGKTQPGRAGTGSSLYGSMPVPNSSADMMNMNRMPPTTGAYGEASYNATAPSAGSHFASGHAPSYETLGYAPAPVRPSFHPLPPADSEARRFSHSSVPALASIEHIETPRATRPPPMRSSMVEHDPRSMHDDRRGFADALDAGHGMLAMSQETPRNIYGNRSDRSSVDSYGFPSTHSTSSSVSSNGNFSSYYGDSVSDYSTAGSDIESVTSRTLPRPQGLMGSQVPPAPQSMMGQFSSKVSSSTQKKHKCKVCDKRFTRPSSLQTHMYSHTGEKPFACEVEGCGRHFSVVSNLRRHRKVHRGDAHSDAGSDDHHSD